MFIRVSRPRRPSAEPPRRFDPRDGGGSIEAVCGHEHRQSLLAETGSQENARFWRHRREAGRTPFVYRAGAWAAHGRSIAGRLPDALAIDGQRRTSAVGESSSSSVAGTSEKRVAR
jgi:hypothetical protein